MLARRLSSLLGVPLLVLAGCGGPGESTPAPLPDDGNATASAAEVSVYRNFTLIDGTGGAAVPSSAMIVEDGRIVWVGRDAEVQVPAGAVEVPLDDRYVIPGLIDLHVHLSVLEDLAFNHQAFTRENVERELGIYASYGVTTVLTQGTDKDLIYAFAREQRSGRPTVARVYTAGQGIVFENGYGGVAGINDPVASPEEAAQAVARQAANGADIVKLWVDDELGTMPKMPPEISRAAIEAAHQHGLRAVAHIFYLEDAKRLVAQGIDGLVHSVRDQAVDAELLEAMKANGTWQASMTLSREAAMLAYAERAPFLDDPFFARAVAPEVIERLGSDEYQERVRSGPHFHEFGPILERAKANAKAVVDGGVEYAFGTDSGPPGRFPGYSAHWELELLVEAGLTPAQALASATGRAARFLEADDLGVLEAGRWADFVVLSANPLENVSNTRAIEAVYIAGRQFEER